MITVRKLEGEYSDLYDISVVIPVYNKTKALLDKCINSVLNQQYKANEIIIVDDGSDIDIFGIVKDYIKDNANIKYIKQEHSGANTARNRGISDAKGPLIVLFDSDDAMLPNNLSTLIEGYKSVKNSEKSVVIIANGIILDDSHEKKCFELYNKEDIHKSVLHIPGPMFQGTLFEKDHFERAGCLDVQTPCFQEWDFMMDITRDAECKYIDKQIYEYNRGKGRSSVYDDNGKEYRAYKYIIDKRKKEIRDVLGMYELLRHYRVISKMGGKRTPIKYMFGGWFFCLLRIIKCDKKS